MRKLRRSEPARGIAERKAVLVMPVATAGPFGEYLVSLNEQFHRIRRYNYLYWRESLGMDEYLTVDVRSKHVQRVGDLELLHVEFGSRAETVERWHTALTGMHATFRGLTGDLWSYGGDLRLAETATRYTRGIHKVRINLLAHHCPTRGRSISDVRRRAVRQGEALAHSEVLSAYGLHPLLLRSLDGKDLPYPELAGFDVSSAAPTGRQGCPYISWAPAWEEIVLDITDTDQCSRDRAAPTLRHH